MDGVNVREDKEWQVNGGPLSESIYCMIKIPQNVMKVFVKAYKRFRLGTNTFENGKTRGPYYY